MTEINYIPPAAKRMIEESGANSRSRAVAGSRPDHPRADEIHPLTRLPKGYRWMKDRETIQPGCKYVKFGSPKWHDITKVGKEYSVFAFHPMARPILSENDRDDT